MAPLLCLLMEPLQSREVRELGLGLSRGLSAWEAV